MRRSQKFTIERQIDGKLLWNCFRASCSAKGVNQGMRSVASAKAYIVGGRNAKRLPPGIPLPNFTTCIENRLEAGQYLRSVNYYQAYKNGLISFKYDLNLTGLSFIIRRKLVLLAGH